MDIWRMPFWLFASESFPTFLENVKLDGRVGPMVFRKAVAGEGFGARGPETITHKVM